MSNLRKAARGRECQVRIPNVCSHNPETTVLAHIRLAGMCGTGIKPPDLIATIACQQCHDEIDRRTHLVDAEYAKECALEGNGPDAGYLAEGGLDIGMSEYHLILPWPPSNNTYYRHGRKGNYISEKGKQYATAVNDIIQQQNLAVKTPHHLSVTIYASPPDIRTRDLDNLSKGVLDALTKAGFWLDDGQIDVLRIERLEKRKGGGLLVVVRELEGKLKRWEDIV